LETFPTLADSRHRSQSKAKVDKTQNAKIAHGESYRPPLCNDLFDGISAYKVRLSPPSTNNAIAVP
jgi:hypothetical protein